MSLHIKNNSYNLKNDEAFIHNPNSNNYNINLRRTFDSTFNYKNNNILLNQYQSYLDSNYDNKYSIKTSIDSNLALNKLNNNNQNICTCNTSKSKSRNNSYNYAPRQNYFNNIYNNTGFHMIKQSQSVTKRRNNSYSKEFKFNPIFNLLNINRNMSNFTIRNKTPSDLRNHSTVFISHLSNPQYENISFSNYSIHPKIMINKIKTVPKLNNNCSEKLYTSRPCMTCSYKNDLSNNYNKKKI